MTVARSALRGLKGTVASRPQELEDSHSVAEADLLFCMSRCLASSRRRG